MRSRGRRVHREPGQGGALPGTGTFVAPTLIEIGDVAELQREVFGPVLHVLRYRRERLGALIESIRATGYGLTMGLHTRIDETIVQVRASTPAGNLYVNRNMVGAVVGVQPFGGDGLSGTGPKAGGPLALFRLLARPPQDVLARAVGSATDHVAPGHPDAPDAAPPDVDRAASRAGHAEPVAGLLPTPAFAALRTWADAHDPALAATARRLAARTGPGASVTLPGPTGERNVYALDGRHGVLCLAAREADQLVQLAAVLAVGGRALWPRTAAALLDRLPAEVRRAVTLVDDGLGPSQPLETVLLHGSPDDLAALQQRLAARPGPVVGVERLAPGDAEVPLERLVRERSISLNTAAAGGNASLMTLG